MKLGILAMLLTAGLASPAAPAAPEAWFQAHRGGLLEVPENTLAALRHAWAIPGAVPEVDLRTTRDGVIVCIHDETPARTVRAPADLASRPIRELDYDVLRQWDAGSHLDSRYAGERVPTLDAVIDLMLASPERQIYLDLKDVDTDEVYRRLSGRGIVERSIFVHGDPATCRSLQEAYPGIRTMTWLSGSPRKIRDGYEALRAQAFQGISQIQFHLREKEGTAPLEYVLDWAFLEEAARTTRSHGVELQVRPFRFDHVSLTRLTQLGIRWFVTDEPQAFHDALTGTDGSG